MKARTILLTVIVCLLAASGFAKDDANLGSWKLNEAKSKIPAGAPKNNSVVYTAAGDQYKAVVDGTDGDGKPTHNEWTGKFNGTDYPVTGDPKTDTRSIKTASANHYSIVNKKDGKATTIGTIVVSADGKTRTLTTQSKDPKGKAVTATFVYDKQ
jgi:hypothetical protein